MIKKALMLKYSIVILLFVFSLNGFGQTFEMFEGDTINKRDAENKRQGTWIKFDNTKKVEEKGQYIANKKEGLWYGYYPSGKLKHEITYTKNRPDGLAKFYYEDGKISEQGIWKINKWVGEYKYFHTNGNLAYDWSYNESGKRTGEQKYYYDDGALMIKGDWTDGKKEGILKEFYPDGSIKSEMGFADGKLDVPSIKEYEIAEKPSQKQVAPNTQAKTNSTSNSSGSDNHGLFTQTGFYKTYNEFKKLDREGDFVNGKLVNGKRYFYDDDGNLKRTLIYKEGKVSESIDHTQN
ncbi:MAG: toxin-antitoxin system YwqK family antitoxin [Salinivirgaceae bacterium]|nr:toxin-antitoxin system YwqK family antitoxin [Salinivirgaceae bacterium]